MGQRIAKIVKPDINDATTYTYTYYGKDARGNTLITYNREEVEEETFLRTSERMIYGISRLGNLLKQDTLIGPENDSLDSGYAIRILGCKRYEGTNHLSNVLTTFSDIKIPVDDNTDGVIDWFEGDPRTSQDYYPFGMLMPERQYSLNSVAYRYGFNGMEKDDEIKGEGNSYDFGARMYDSRLGRWFSTDRMHALYPANSPYSFAIDNPIKFKDGDGNVVVDENGNIIFTVDDPNSAYIQANRVYYGPDGKLYREVLFFEAEVGRILTDDGQEVVAYRATTTNVKKRVFEVDPVTGKNAKLVSEKIYTKDDYDCSHNCTGNALTNKLFTISSNQITEEYRKSEGWKPIPLDQAQAGDVGMYISTKSGSKGIVTHLEPFLSEGTVSTKGGIVKDPGPSKPGESEHFKKNATYQVYTKTTPNTQIVWQSRVVGTLNLNEGLYEAPKLNVDIVEYNTDIGSNKVGVNIGGETSGGVRTVNNSDFEKAKTAVKKNTE